MRKAVVAHSGHSLRCNDMSVFGAERARVAHQSGHAVLRPRGGKALHHARALPADLLSRRFCRPGIWRWIESIARPAARSRMAPSGLPFGGGGPAIGAVRRPRVRSICRICAACRTYQSRHVTRACYQFSHTHRATAGAPTVAKLDNVTECARRNVGFQVIALLHAMGGGAAVSFVLPSRKLLT